MQIKDIYLKLQKFVVLATGLPDEKVVSLNDSFKTKPKKPYITIAASAFKNNGTPIDKTVNDSGELRTTASMVFTASFQAFSAVDYGAEELLSNLYINFSTELQANIFNGEMAKRRTIKHVSAVPIISNEQTENRAILEVEMGYMKSVIEQVGIIDTVEMKNLMSKKTYSIGLTKSPRNEELSNDESDDDSDFSDDDADSSDDEFVDCRDN
jgi:hypothetical protein